MSNCNICQSTRFSVDFRILASIKYKKWIKSIFLKPKPKFPSNRSNKVNNGINLEHSAKTWTTVSIMVHNLQDDKIFVLNLETNVFVGDTQCNILTSSLQIVLKRDLYARASNEQVHQKAWYIPSILYHIYDWYLHNNQSLNISDKACYFRLPENQALTAP